MADYADADVQDELQAMTGAPKEPLFGANRSKCAISYLSGNDISFNFFIAFFSKIKKCIN